MGSKFLTRVSVRKLFLCRMHIEVLTLPITFGIFTTVIFPPGIPSISGILFVGLTLFFQTSSLLAFIVFLVWHFEIVPAYPEPYSLPSSTHETESSELNY